MSHLPCGIRELSVHLILYGNSDRTSSMLYQRTLCASDLFSIIKVKIVFLLSVMIWASLLEAIIRALCLDFFE